MKNDNSTVEQFVADLNRDFTQTEQQREDARAEMRFSTVAGAHWEGELGEKYTNRAKLEIDMVSDHSNRVYAQWCNNRRTVNYSPDSSTTSQDDADLMDGLWRRDYLRRGGKSAVDNAVLEAIRCGVGAFGLTEEYEDEYDPLNMRQNIHLEEIPEAYRVVFFDSSAVLADKSDAKHVTKLTPYHKDDLAEMYPNVIIGNMDNLTSNTGFNWKASNLIYIATRYHKQVKKMRVNAYSNPNGEEVITLEGEEIKLDEPELLAAGWEKLTSRMLKRSKVYKTVFCNGVILEDTIQINGDYLPIIPVYAYRSFVDGIEHYHGVVRKRMDSQRLLDMSFSLAAEAAAYASQRKPIFTPEQMASRSARQSWSKSAHTKAYRLVDPIKDNNGNNVAYVAGWDEGGGLAPAATALIDMSSNHIAQGTAGAAQDTLDPDASGKAINAVTKRMDMNTIIIFDNIEKSIVHTGNVYASKARSIYGTKANRGRVLQLLNDKNEIRAVELFQSKPDIRGIYTANDPSKGIFQVVSGVSKGYDTEAEETITALKDIAVSLPDGHPLREMAFGKIVQLLPNSDLDDMKWFIRKQELTQGAEPTNDKETQFVTQMQQQQAQQSNEPDMQKLLMENMALEQRSKAEMQAAKVEQMAVQNTKIDAEAKNKQADTALKIREAMLNIR